MKIILAALVLAAPATAQHAGTPAPGPEGSPPAEKKVCRYQATTGSIMPSRRVCHTKAEWAQTDAANAANTDGVLQQRERGSLGEVPR